MRKWLVLCSLSIGCFAQQAQTHDVPSGGLNPEPIFGANAKWVQGIGPGYWCTAGTGLTLKCTAGLVWCFGTERTYAGGTLAMTNSATNYVYFDPTPASNCAPAVSTSIFTGTQYPIATVVASGGVITTITNSRPWFSLWNVTYNGQTEALGGTANVNVGAATHSLALNEGNGNAITGLLLGAHQVPVGIASADPVAKTVPDCIDTGGNHLNYTQSTDVFSCGTTSAALATVLTRRTCMIVVGADNGPALLDADLGPQLDQCFIPFAATVVEVEVMADAGTPNVIVQRSHLGTATALLSSALATASAGAVACSNTGGTTGLDGTTTCTNTLQNTAVAVGDWIGLTSGTAGGTAKRMSVAVVFTVN